MALRLAIMHPTATLNTYVAVYRLVSIFLTHAHTLADCPYAGGYQRDSWPS
jgi:hypothetical protein